MIRALPEVILAGALAIAGVLAGGTAWAQAAPPAETGDAPASSAPELRPDATPVETPAAPIATDAPTAARATTAPAPAPDTTAPVPAPTTTAPVPAPTTTAPAPAPTTTAPAPAPTTTAPAPAPATTAPAPATTAPTAPRAAASPRPAKSLGLELGFATPSGSAQHALLLSPELSFRYRLRTGTGLSVRMGFAGLHLSSDGAPSESRVTPGNPVVGLTRPWRVHGLDLRWGASAAVGPFPLPHGVNDSRLARNALAYASAARGLWSPWEWLPIQFALVAPIELEPVTIGPAVVRAEAALAYVLRAERVIPAGQTTYGDVYLQGAVEGALAHRAARLGLRAQAVAFWTGGTDHAQLALSPFAAVTTRPADLQLRVVIPVDDPLARVTPWALELAAAARF